jgi:hypothetical protein
MAVFAGTPTSPPHKYVYMNPAGDQHWTTDPNDPLTLQGNCIGDCLARFLLGVEVGVILGADGWDESYSKPLGDPLGPAVWNTTHLFGAFVFLAYGARSSGSSLFWQQFSCETTRSFAETDVSKIIDNEAVSAGVHRQDADRATCDSNAVLLLGHKGCVYLR